MVLYMAYQTSVVTHRFEPSPELREYIGLPYFLEIPKGRTKLYEISLYRSNCISPRVLRYFFLFLSIMGEIR